MKRCTYCGRDYAEELQHCPDCGTEFGPEQANPMPRPRRDFVWVRITSLYVLGALLLFLAYFLSLGPVARYTATVISQSSITNASGITFQRAVKYPGWVGVVYYPVFSWSSSGQDRGLQSLYSHYLGWWEEPPPPTSQ